MMFPLFIVIFTHPPYQESAVAVTVVLILQHSRVIKPSECPALKLGTHSPGVGEGTWSGCCFFGFMSQKKMKSSRKKLQQNDIMEGILKLLPCVLYEMFFVDCNPSCCFSNIRITGRWTEAWEFWKKP